MPKELAIHECLELHELLLTKNSALSKMAAMSGVAKDEKLKTLINDGMTAARTDIQALQGFLS